MGQNINMLTGIVTCVSSQIHLISVYYLKLLINPVFAVHQSWIN